MSAPRLQDFLIAVLLLLAPVELAAQTRTEVIRGRVTTDSGTVVPGAEVIATMAPDRTTRSTVTDAEGRYEIRFPGGTGDYLLHVHAEGRPSFRKRVTRSGTEESELVVDVQLASVAATHAIQGITVQATRPKPRRGPEAGTEAGASETFADGVTATLAPDQAGDIGAMAATTPGVTVTPGGISVLGLDPGQNSVTLNGLAFGGSDVPRDVRMRTRVSTSTYDPSRGGFSGAQVALELSPGGNFEFRRAHLTLDAPPFQAADEVSAHLGQQFTGLRASAGGDGSLVEGKFYYNGALQLTRRASDVSSLFDAESAVLRHMGVSADSASRLLGLLSTYGVPTLVNGGVPARITDEGSLIARIDRTPYGRRAWGITAYTKFGRSEALGVSPLATPAYGGSASSIFAGVQALHSMYFGQDYLNETRTAFSFNRNRAVPYARVPAGRVLVSSPSADGLEGGIRWLEFGGSGALNNHTLDWTWETTNETVWYTSGRPHRFKLAFQSRLDGYAQTVAANRLGTYTYHSLADVAANRPAAFTRVLDAPDREGGEWSGALSLGDLWRPVPNLQLLYGARLEANRFLSTPAFNPAVLSTFGARTDRAPNTVHVSPRLGFTWSYGGGKQIGGRTVSSAFGTFFRGPTGVLRGGIGEFRNLLPPTLLSGALVSTGLPGDTRSLRCVGPAVPVPDWSAYAANPAAVAEQCLEPGSVFTEAAPSVHLFDPSFTAPRSWRANLAWLSAYKKLTFSVEGIYSLNLDQPGIEDLNFRGVPGFRLAGEGNRPVFVNPGSIDPVTGALSPVEARISDAFGSVVAHRSDLRSVSRQITVTAFPELPPGRAHMSLAYTLSGTQALTRGFDGAAFGDPQQREWARADADVRHQFLLQGGLTAKGVTLTLFGRLTSGVPFTPLVNGDVNGDGRGGDRAFVFDPAAADPALAEGMQSLLTRAPERVRECLTDQLGRAAERNACTGPWRQSVNARLAFSNRLLRTGKRVNVALNLSNPLGGLDRLLHGSAGLRGWGSPAPVDPVLYSVRGFDPVEQRFLYGVNPRFGEVNRSFGAPFRITLDVSLDWGTPLQVQQLRRTLDRGRGGRPGERLSADSLKKHYARTVPSIYGMILEHSDSLLLAPEQVRALQEAEAGYDERADAVWTELAEHLASLGDSYDASDVFRRVEEATDRVWEIAKEQGPTIRSILSPLQLRLAPETVVYVITTKDKIQIRYYYQ